MSKSLVLDFDASLQAFPDADIVPLTDWQEAVRFGCGMTTWRKLASELQAKIPPDHGTVFMGSGDFHHISHLLIARCPSTQPFDVVVFDNHPDNMRFPFGIHCGSWVRHVAALPHVRTVHVVGISSGDVGWRHAWENYLLPLYAGRIHYWTLGVDTRWAGVVGLASRFHSFTHRKALIEAFIAWLQRDDTSVYLSIDKDVLDASVARTNWDQGHFLLEDIERVIAELQGRLVGSDITGEISIHHYRARWKRWLSAMDEQPVIAPEQLAAWQAQQIAVNHRLLTGIRAACGA
ncbi:MAG: hypothetical protein JWM03_949 [Rhodocyclales bacterium]|nr:hypothetical protein [Rhodocyclales bacterium]MDB5888077.1 hypothetical protein [Rhodocyclales bacterium]